MNPTGLNCIDSTLWFAEDVYPGQTGWLWCYHEWSWCNWIYHGWFWFSKSFWRKSVQQTLFNTSCLASHNRTLRDSIIIFAAINHYIATASCTLILPVKAKEGNRAHLHESQMTEKQNVTDEDLGLLTKRTHSSLAAIKYKWFMSCVTKFPHMRITHIITAKALVAIQGIYGININFSESRVTCRFQYHLHSLYCMLPYLAGFGPNCHTKSVTMYFEKLYNFERKHPEMYTTYLEHGDTVRRSDRL